MIAAERADSLSLARLLERLGPVILGVAIVYAFSNACKGKFLFDDELNIIRNTPLRTLWPIWVPMFPPGSSGTAGRPLTGLSLAINYAIDGLNPRWYHAGNLLIHWLGACTLLGILRRVFRLVGHAHAKGLALAVCLVWAVHPLLTDAVTYASNRSEVLMGLFFFLTVYTFLRAIDSEHPRRWLALSVACCLAAAASKEVGVMTTPAVLMIDALIVTRSWKQTFRRRWVYYLAMAGTMLILPISLMTASFQNIGVLAIKTATPWQYLMMQSQIITRYLQLAFWPSPLCICYVDWPVPHRLAEVWPWMAFIGALVLMTVYGLARNRTWAALGLWFFLILGPTSSVLPIMAEPAGERRMYLPLVAVVCGTVLVIERVLRLVPHPGAVKAVATVLAVLTLGQVTLFRNEDFADRLSIWSDTIAKRPNNPRAHYALGQELAVQGYEEGALSEYDKALAIAPSYREPVVPRIISLSKLGRTQEALATTMAQLQLHPDDPDLLTVLGSVYFEEGDHARAKQVWRSVLKLKPNDAEAARLLDEANKRDPAS